MEDKRYITHNKSQNMIDEYEEIKRGINGLVKTISERKEATMKKGSKKL